MTTSLYHTLYQGGQAGTSDLLQRLLQTQGLEPSHEVLVCLLVWVYLSLAFSVCLHVRATAFVTHKPALKVLVALLFQTLATCLHNYLASLRLALLHPLSTLLVVWLISKPHYRLILVDALQAS